MRAGPHQPGAGAVEPDAKKRCSRARNQSVFCLLIFLFLICLVVCPLDPSWNTIGVDDAQQVGLVSRADSLSAFVPADFLSAVPPETQGLPGQQLAIAILESGLLCFPTLLHGLVVELPPTPFLQVPLSLRLEGRAPPSFPI